MGALDIRMRSASLGNIGGVNSVHIANPVLDNTADIRKRANDELFSSLSGGLLDAARTVQGVMTKRQERLDEERKQTLRDAYANKFQEKMLAYNQGDGKDVLGAMNETIPESDRGEWMEKNLAEAKKIHAKVLEGMKLTDEDFKDSRMQKWRDSFMFKQSLQWLSKRNSDMAASTKREADKAYEGAFMDVTGKLVSENGWRDWRDAAVRKAKVNNMGPEETALFFRRESEKVWGVGIKVKLDETMQDALLAGKDGGKAFDDLDKAWRGDEKTGKGGLTPEALMPPGCSFVEKDKDGNVVRGKDGKPVMCNPLKEWTKDADFASIKAGALKSVKDYKARFEREYAARVATEQRTNFDAFSAGLRKTASGMVDTKVAMANRGTLETPEAYDLRVDQLVEAEKLDAKSGEAFKKSYRQMLDHTDWVIGEAKAGRGVWTTVKGRDGKAMEVFQSDRRGNGKAETDPTFAAKYTLVGRDGKTPYMDDPAKGMEELDFDLRMGNISVPFYNAQMGKMRVFSDTKAKEAFVRIFGASPEIFSDKDIEAYSKRGIDTETKDVYAKNRWWAGNHQIGNRDATWQEDAIKKDGGETKIEAEQQAQIYDIILDLTAQGVDPTKAIEAYLAPTIKGWMNTDLEERINPDRKIGGKSFREWVLESDRFNAGNSPAEREARLRARQKKAYGDVGDDNK